MPLPLLPAIGGAFASLSSLQRVALGIAVGVLLSMSVTIWLKSKRIDHLQNALAADALAIAQFQRGQLSNLGTIESQARALESLRRQAELRNQTQARALAAMRAEIERQAHNNDRLEDELQTSITDDMRACAVPAGTWRVLQQTATHSGGD